MKTQQRQRRRRQKNKTNFIKKRELHVCVCNIWQEKNVQTIWIYVYNMYSNYICNAENIVRKLDDDQKIVAIHNIDRFAVIFLNYKNTKTKTTLPQKENIFDGSALYIYSYYYCQFFFVCVCLLFLQLFVDIARFPTSPFPLFFLSSFEKWCKNSYASYLLTLPHTWIWYCGLTDCRLEWICQSMDGNFHLILPAATRISTFTHS